MNVLIKMKLLTRIAVLALSGCAHAPGHSLSGSWSASGADTGLMIFDPSGALKAGTAEKNTAVGKWTENGDTLLLTIDSSPPNPKTVKVAWADDNHITLTSVDAKGTYPSMSLQRMK